MSSSSDVLDAVFPELGAPLSTQRGRSEHADHRRAGFDAGYADGLAAGRAAAEAEQEARRAELDAQQAHTAVLLAAIADAAGRIDARQAAAFGDVAHEVAEAALALAAAVIGREPAIAVTSVAQALALVPGAIDPVVRLHPDDVAIVQVPDGVRVVADPTVGPGGCMVDAGDTRVDGRIDAALARARNALLCYGEESW